MKTIVKIIVSVLWTISVPFIFIFGLMPIMFIVVFICNTLDEDDNTFLSEYKAVIAELWDFLSLRNLIGKLICHKATKQSWF